MVLLAIADSVNDQHGNELWMRAKTLASKARVNDQTARVAVRQLVADGWLEADAEADDRQRSGHPARYWFVFDDARPIVYETRGGRAHDARGSATDTRGGSASRARGSAPRATQQNPSKTQALTQDESARREAAFDEFWSKYPSVRRVDKAGCKRRVLAALAEKTAPDVIGGLDRWLAHWAGADKRFIPMSATWLNQRRWETDPGPPTRGRGGATKGATADDLQRAFQLLSEEGQP